MEVRLDPKPTSLGEGKGKAKAGEGHYWSLWFTGQTENELKRSKAMLRRMESTTLNMPDA